MQNDKKFSNGLTIKMRFTLILGTLVIGFALFGFATLKAMKILNVNGPIYQHIAQGKDIIADVLPPPEYIIESYLVALQLTQATNQREISALITRFQLLKTEYESRHQYWLEQSLDQDIRQSLLVSAYQAAQTFFSVANQNFLPGIKTGDEERSKASLEQMHRAYEAHRLAINEVVKLTTVRNTEDEAQAQYTIHKYKIILTGIFIFSVTLAVLLTVLISRGILRSLKSIQQIAGAIAEGDLNSSIDINQRDELGDLLCSMKTMQQQLLARLTANQELLEETNRLKMDLENISVDGSFDWNLQSDKIGFSKRWSEIIGCAEHEFPNNGTAWMATFHPDDSALVLSRLRDYFSGDQPMFTVEFRMRVTEISWKWILARGKLVKRDVHGNPLQLIGTLSDISETKALQAQLGQAQKLEAIGQLAAGVAHEINTPIQYIGDNLSALHDYFGDLVAYQQAVLDLLDSALTPQLTALADKYDVAYILEDSPKAIQQAQEGVERVAEIVKAMKTFSYVEQGQNKQVINLHEALKSALIISRNSYKHIAEIETDFSPEISSIECYANELNQVFLNLIINAAHAIEEKQAGMGKIKIVTRKLGDNIEILFQDNGVGIPTDIQEKVFNLFFTTKIVGKGTGQGLSLSHNIVVDKHGGKLFFDSSPGHGTTFHIQLPQSFLVGSIGYD
jgi:signal transduction histidine kinase/HAMP domain-containing protein